ncbi:amphi-Trp domain-containing protein [Streptomyces phaeoluteigriseus]
MRDVKFEQKRALTRFEAADQLTAIANALREGADAELDLGSGTLSLRIPDDLRSEVEIEIGDGEVELEIELKWPTASTRTAPAREAAGAQEATTRDSVSAKPARSSTSTGRGKGTKRSATKP